MKKLFSILLILPALYSCSLAQVQKKYGELITEESSRNHLTILASKEFEGRGTGQEGGRKAANYIAEHFKSYGLQPIVNGNSFFQPVSLLRTEHVVKNFSIDQTPFENGKDFYVQGDNDIEKFSSQEIVFVGYGLQHPSYNELKSTDIKGKVILVLNEGEPFDDNGNSLLTGNSNESEWSKSRFKRIQELVKLEPKLILATTPIVAGMLNRMKGRSSSARISLGNNTINRTISQPIPIVNISEKIANQILSKANSSLASFKKLASNGIQAPLVIKSHLEAEMGVNQEKLDDPNVLGLLEGSDLKNEVMVICGHYDHDGILPDGTFFPGADDNGSGTVAVLELARAFSTAKKEGKGPRRSILFIGLAAEEKGLLGSKFYVENPIIPLANTVACINIDMIGRIDDKHLNGDHNYIHAIGLDKLSSELQQVTEKANKDFVQIGLDYSYNDPNEPMRLYYRSDHYNFAQKGIPSAFFFSGLHPHYHTPEDTVDKIDFPMMVKREKLIFYTAWEIANRSKRLVVDSNKK
ncbi:M28 family peptidase [Sphingobacterium paucimobilis]|uniref:Peptidase M28 domain-containing protein n=1 Tax=Sphingobacterium paucimobilis HER1398 TaxID=1346330 RepID=U2JDJ5_9SPHI|nr:M28 family peptidase [Sphingobacterium paucimobilis]ERJ60743.1 hypothetical protein M472_18455 [Sphingobacterium paucimobilis HER1398]